MQIKSSIIRDICYNHNSEFSDEWECIEDKIVGNDTEDGGASYEAIVKNVSTGEFYRADYQDWDFYWEYSEWKEDDDKRTIDTGEMMEIYPVKVRQVTITIYE